MLNSLELSSGALSFGNPYSETFSGCLIEKSYPCSFSLAILVKSLIGIGKHLWSSYSGFLDSSDSSSHSWFQSSSLAVFGFPFRSQCNDLYFSPIVYKSYLLITDPFSLLSLNVGISTVTVMTSLDISSLWCFCKACLAPFDAICHLTICLLPG